MFCAWALLHIENTVKYCGLLYERGGLQTTTPEEETSRATLFTFASGVEHIHAQWSPLSTIHVVFDFKDTNNDHLAISSECRISSNGRWTAKLIFSRLYFFKWSLVNSIICILHMLCLYICVLCNLLQQSNLPILGSITYNWTDLNRAELNRNQFYGLTSSSRAKCDVEQLRPAAAFIYNHRPQWCFISKQRRQWALFLLSTIGQDLHVCKFAF